MLVVRREKSVSQREEEERNFPDPFEGSKPKHTQEQKNGNIASKLYTSSKIDELREVLSLLREKIGIVEHSIERKDSHIR